MEHHGNRDNYTAGSRYKLNVWQQITAKFVTVFFACTYCMMGLAQNSKINLNNYVLYIYIV